MVSQQLAEKFRQVVAEDYGREISVEEAARILSDAVAFFDLLARLDHNAKESDQSLEEGLPNSSEK